MRRRCTRRIVAACSSKALRLRYLTASSVSQICNAIRRQVMAQNSASGGTNRGAGKSSETQAGKGAANAAENGHGALWILTPE